MKREHTNPIENVVDLMRPRQLFPASPDEIHQAVSGVQPLLQSRRRTHKAKPEQSSLDDMLF